MFKVIGLSAVCTLAFGLLSLAQVTAADDGFELKSGKYELRLLTPQMAEGKKDIILPAEIELKNGDIVIHTQGILGNKVTLRGTCEEGTIKAGMTAVEKSSILSFHYIGKVQSPQQAKGKFHCFVDGKAAFAGDWVLTVTEQGAAD